MAGGSKFDLLVAECHSWQLLVGVHEPGQTPLWRLQDPEKLDSNRRDVVMMTRAFVDGHKGHLDRLIGVSVVRPLIYSNQGLIALSIGAAVAALPSDAPSSHEARDLTKLSRAIGEKIPALGDLAPYLVALEFTGTTDFSKTKKKAGNDKKPDERTLADDVTGFFDGFEEFGRDLRKAWDETKKDWKEGAEAARRDMEEVRAEVRRDTEAAKAELDAAVTRAKERTRKAWPTLRDRIDGWLADKPPEPPKS